MALAKDLEIYKSAQALLTLALKVQAQVPRAYRLALGQRISDECAAVLVAVSRANVARGASRMTQIDLLLKRLEAATVLLKAAHDLRAISHKAWGESIELTDSVGKQAQGWLKASRNLSAAPAA